MEDAKTLYSQKQLKLQIELIINKKLYGKNKIIKDTYAKVEQSILKDIENEKIK
jgi:hypothetical protein